MTPDDDQITNFYRNSEKFVKTRKGPENEMKRRMTELLVDFVGSLCTVSISCRLVSKAFAIDLQRFSTLAKSRLLSAKKWKKQIRKCMN
jgi:hypothetical protein